MTGQFTRLVMAVAAGLLICGAAALATLPATIGTGAAQPALSGPLDASLLGLGRSAT